MTRTLTALAALTLALGLSACTDEQKAAYDTTMASLMGTPVPWEGKDLAVLYVRPSITDMEPIEVAEPEPAPECQGDVFRVSRCVDGKLQEW